MQKQTRHVSVEEWLPRKPSRWERCQQYARLFSEACQLPHLACGAIHLIPEMTGFGRIPIQSLPVRFFQCFDAVATLRLSTRRRHPLEIRCRRPVFWLKIQKSLHGFLRLLPAALRHQSARQHKVSVGQKEF